MKFKLIYQNRLPHLAPIGATFFVTFRLHDSLPAHVIKELKETTAIKIQTLLKTRSPGYELAIELEKSKSFKKYDAQLDRHSYGNCYLKDPNIATLAQDRLHELDQRYYKLIAYTVMPNHVHILFDTSIQLEDGDGFYKKEIPEDYLQLDEIMRYIKGNTAYKINRRLNRRGKFWQKDSFDRYMRNENERNNTANYIIQNPVKAGLVSHWEDYPFTFLHPELR